MWLIREWVSESELEVNEPVNASSKYENKLSH